MVKGNRKRYGRYKKRQDTAPCKKNFLVITDIILINGSVFLSLIMRFEINIASVPEGIYTKSTL